ncbi:MAG: zinc ABC transporter substrate-binding protein [Clostridia bacterium]|nr:zinc ABC transporter substrate-binding protein [Clostridia bacterium]
MTVKKITAAAICAVLTLTGCGAAPEQKTDKLSVVTTVFPEYDWVREIAGDNADITMLLDNGVDMHSYQPAAADIMKISDCDIFIYVGGESDAWVEDALKEAVNKNMTVIDLLDILGDAAKLEEPLPGTEAEDVKEYDEHVWLSLKNAERLCAEIAEAMSGADAENAEIYRQNAAEYIKKLDALDKEYIAAVSEAKHDTLVFGDRFPFGYMTDDYGLSYYAAFEGCSAETEASFETVAFLAGKLDELGLNCVMTIDGSDKRIAQTIIESSENKDRKILTLDSMQSTTMKDIKDGASYYGIMESDLGVLKEALGG